MIQKKVEKIKEEMRNLFPTTPLEYSDYLSKKYGANIYLKQEDLTPVRSYKIKGVFHLIDSILKKTKNKKQKFVCASAENHAQGFPTLATTLKFKELFLCQPQLQLKKLKEQKILVENM